MRQGSRLSPLFATVLALMAQPTAAFAQGQVITGKVSAEGGVPTPTATVYIEELGIGVQTNAAGAYTLTVPAVRLSGKAAILRARVIGYRPDAFPITLSAGRIEHDFVLKADINRLSEVVVTGSIEGTERSKVPFAVGRLTTDDVPVPSSNPLTALSGKVAGMRIAQSDGQPGSSPQIMMRGPTSINVTGRNQSPLIIVDGVIMRVGSLEEIGGLDIESVEVVKGAAGASLYGSTAANGVILIKTKRGGTQDGVRFNVRSELGMNDLNSTAYGEAQFHLLGMDETGTRFCVQGAGAIGNCSRTMNFMQEILRINNVNADTVRTPQTFQYSTPSASTGQLQNTFQAGIWPGQYYNSLARVSTSNQVKITSVDATGRAGLVQFFVSGAYTDDPGSLKYLKGQQQARGRMNLDFDARSDLRLSVRSLFDQGTTDLNTFAFGAIYRGLPAGFDALALDSLGRPLLRSGGVGIKGSNNGQLNALYNAQNESNMQESQRVLASGAVSYTPMEWLDIEGTMGYDTRRRSSTDYVVKGYRTVTSSSATNLGNISVGNNYTSSLNGNASLTIRRQLRSNLASKFFVQGLYDQSTTEGNSSAGEQFVVKEIYTLSNAITNFSTSSNSTKIVNMGVVGGANFDIKDKYIIDGTYRYDGSSLFGAGNRWAPFGRISGVWRISEEPFFKVPHVSDMRFRLSRGTAGNTPSFTAQYETYSCTASGCSLGQAGNRKLKPETTAEVEGGVDLTLFDRLGLELSNARSTTRDQILNVSTPANLGFSNQWQNAGTLTNNTYEVSANLRVVSRRDLQWNMRASWDRTRTYITKLNVPEYFSGQNDFFRITADPTVVDGVATNRFGNIWGRAFYKTCGQLPASVQPQCGAGKAFQVNDDGWVVWVGEGNSYKDGISKNLWNAKLPAANSPWNYPLYWGHAIIERPLAGEVGEQAGVKHILGNVLPSFRTSYNTTLTFKRLTMYGLLDGTFGHSIYNRSEGWGLFDYSSATYDMANKTIETAKPVGYSWRVGGSEGVGTGGFYDLNAPNTYNVEDGSFVKLREMSVSYKVGPIMGVGDWTLGVVGRNLKTWTKYSGVDPEVGSNSGEFGSLINQVDAFGFPTLRSFSFSVTTRF